VLGQVYRGEGGGEVAAETSGLEVLLPGTPLQSLQLTLLRAIGSRWGFSVGRRQIYIVPCCTVTSTDCRSKNHSATESRVDLV